MCFPNIQGPNTSVLEEQEFPQNLPLQEIMSFLQIAGAEQWPIRIAVVLHFQSCLHSNCRLNNIYVSSLCVIRFYSTLLSK